MGEFLSRRNFIKISALGALGLVADPLTSRKDTLVSERNEETWAGYKIENANIGYINNVTIEKGGDVLNESLNATIKSALKKELSRIFQNNDTEKEFYIDTKAVRVTGSGGKILLPFVATHSLLNGRVDRWSVWTLTEGGRSLKVPPETENIDSKSLILIPIAELSTLGNPAGGRGKGPDIIGPFFNDGVVVILRTIDNSGWFFVPPFPDLKDQIISVKGKNSL